MMNTFSKLKLLGLLLAVGGAHASNRDDQIERSLQEFARDPQKFYQKIPEKFRPDGTLVKRTRVAEDLRLLDPQIPKRKLKLREKMLSTPRGEEGRWVVPRIFGEMITESRVSESYDGILDLDRRSTVNDLSTMAHKKLEESELTVSPWSDSYWPVYRGILGARYADQGFAGIYSGEFSDYRHFISSPENKFPELIQDGGSDVDAKISKLSPSEKYDLLIGDSNATLTTAMWAEGDAYARSNNGTVERWMGICHGWAPASYREARPVHSVRVMAADGKTPITFFPSDIKGLTSLLWAEGRVRSRSIGNRCNEKDPPADPAGRILDPLCFDINPEDWHYSVVNQIGLAHKSFVIDATYDYEVWNQPVVAYKYSYFNPLTKKSVKTLAEATVRLDKYSQDPFKKHRHRSEGAVVVVGIAMDLTYIFESSPSHDDPDSDENDVRRTVRYLYDLELTSSDEIVGGQWYQRAHPDFLWNPVLDQQAESVGDIFTVGSWAEGQPVPDSWRQAIHRSGASRVRQPLGPLVRTLIEWANR